jgi:hypothetical protein
MTMIPADREALAAYMANATPGGGDNPGATYSSAVEPGEIHR